MKLDHMKDDGGKFISYAWPGGYPVFYITHQNCVLCPDCANKDGYDDEVEAADINYEDSGLVCDDCCERIESAYCDED